MIRFHISPTLHALNTVYQTSQCTVLLLKILYPIFIAVGRTAKIWRNNHCRPRSRPFQITCYNLLEYLALTLYTLMSGAASYLPKMCCVSETKKVIFEVVQPVPACAEQTSCLSGHSAHHLHCSRSWELRTFRKLIVTFPLKFGSTTSTEQSTGLWRHTWIL
jgi:hypothetical protein